MATISDVQDSLATLIVSILYPAPAPAASVLNYPVKVYPGWPSPEQLDLDLADSPAKSGRPTAAHVSIYPLPGERNVSRFQGKRQPRAVKAPTYGLTSGGQALFITGAAPSPYFAQNLAVTIGGSLYVYQATAGQTPAEVAGGLLALIAVDIPSASLSGASITLPSTAHIGRMMVGTVGETIREVSRQEKQFQISVWSSNPVSRAAIADFIDPVLKDTPSLTLADGSVGRLLYHGSREDDFAQKQRIYRRSFIYMVEYATTIIEQATQIVAPLVVAVNVAGELMFVAAGAPDPDDGVLDWSDEIALLPGLI